VGFTFLHETKCILKNRDKKVSLVFKAEGLQTC
jgi:hypothetical protein